MKQNNRIAGIHHITAIASSAGENLTFYEHLLGLRLVKKTVNFDDPITSNPPLSRRLESEFVRWMKMPSDNICSSWRWRAA